MTTFICRLDQPGSGPRIAAVTGDQQNAARAYQAGRKAVFARFLDRVDAIAPPTVPFFPPNGSSRRPAAHPCDGP